MKCLEKGHIYQLENKVSGLQLLTFFKDLPQSGEGHDGVLNQEVIRALLDRNRELYLQKPCNETHEIIMLLERVIVLAETRAFKLTLEKAYSKVGLKVDQLPVQRNGHIFDLVKE